MGGSCIVVVYNAVLPIRRIRPCMCVCLLGKWAASGESGDTAVDGEFFWGMHWQMVSTDEWGVARISEGFGYADVRESRQFVLQSRTKSPHWQNSKDADRDTAVAGTVVQNVSVLS